MVFSLLVSGSIAELIGRKLTLIIGQLFVLFGWIIIYFSNNFLMLLFGRFINGLGVGLCLPGLFIFQTKDKFYILHLSNLFITSLNFKT